MLQCKPSHPHSVLRYVRANTRDPILTLMMEAMLALQQRVCMFCHAELAVYEILLSRKIFWILQTKLGDSFLGQRADVFERSCWIVMLYPLLSALLVCTDRRNGVSCLVY